MARILVVDDEENIRLVLRTLLRSNGHEIALAPSAEDALDLLDEFRPDFALVDVRMRGMSGIDFTRAVRERVLQPTIIIMSAYGSVELAIEAIKAGAYDYIAKPFKKDEVLLALAKAVEREELRRENAALRRKLGENLSRRIVGESDPIKAVFRTVEKVARYTTTVLIQGESGTGKELVARAIHESSPRKSERFVAVNCGAIPAALMESELFGHKKGAFTDATSDKDGLFAQANGGTLFLDEIGELPLELQVKLLRVLQEGTVRPVGGTKTQEVDVRVIAATVRNLEEEVKESRFREDLFYRLNVLPIVVPPLRSRPSDIPLLIEFFVNKGNGRHGTTKVGMSPEALKVAMDYPWPGNVRQLENVVERAMVLSEGDVLGLEDLPPKLSEKGGGLSVHLGLGPDELSIKKTHRYMEELLIRKALERTGGNRTAASKLLEISHRALLYKIKDFGIT